MHITQNEIVAIVLILAILWVWFTWDKNTESFTNLTVPKGKKWGDYVYYEDENEFPVIAPSITRAEGSVEETQYKLPEMLTNPIHKKFAKINDVGGMTDTSNVSSMGAPFDDTLDFDDSLINKMNQEDNRSQDSIVHELPKSHDHHMGERAKHILTEKELMPGMEQKKIMEKSLEPQVKQPIIVKQKPKKKPKKLTEDRYMALAILLAVLLIGFVQHS